MLAENIMKIHLPKHSSLILAKEYRQAISFGIDTKCLLIDLCDTSPERTEAIKEVDALVAEAKLAIYNRNWDLELQEDQC